MDQRFVVAQYINDCNVVQHLLDEGYEIKQMVASHNGCWIYLTRKNKDAL